MLGSVLGEAFGPELGLGNELGPLLGESTGERSWERLLEPSWVQPLGDAQVRCKHLEQLEEKPQFRA
jgi:hypothetical protein